RQRQAKTERLRPESVVGKFAGLFEQDGGLVRATRGQESPRLEEQDLPPGGVVRREREAPLPLLKRLVGARAVSLPKRQLLHPRHGEQELVLAPRRAVVHENALQDAPGRSAVSEPHQKIHAVPESREISGLVAPAHVGLKSGFELSLRLREPSGPESGDGDVERRVGALSVVGSGRPPGAEERESL